MRKVLLIVIALGVLLFSGGRAAAAVEVVIDCLATPAGVAGASISVSFRLTVAPDCPEGQPPVRGMTFLMPSPQTAEAKAMALAAAIMGDGGNVRCGDPVVPPPVFRGIVAAVDVDIPTRVNISPENPADHIVSLQVNDNTQAGGAVKGKNGTTQKSLTVSGVAAGGSVTVQINPIVTVNTTPGQSSFTVLQNISNALNVAGFAHSVVTVPASGMLQGGNNPAPLIQNTHAIIAPGHPAVEDGLWVQSNDPGLRGVKQVDMNTEQQVPTLPQWGLILLTVGVLAGGVVVILRRRQGLAAPA